MFHAIITVMTKKIILHIGGMVCKTIKNNKLNIFEINFFSVIEE